MATIAVGYGGFVVGAREEVGAFEIDSLEVGGDWKGINFEVNVPLGRNQIVVDDSQFVEYKLQQN